MLIPPTREVGWAIQQREGEFFKIVIVLWEAAVHHQLGLDCLPIPFQVNLAAPL